MSLGDGVSKISWPGDELFQESVDALDRLWKDGLNGLRGKQKDVVVVGERKFHFYPLAYIHRRTRSNSYLKQDPDPRNSHSQRPCKQDKDDKPDERIEKVVLRHGE